MAAPVLAARDLSIGMRGAGGEAIPVVRQVSLALMEGETLGIVGESGCGKSTLLNALIGHVKPGLAVLGGEALLGAVDMLACPAAERERLRGAKIGFVPQNATQTLTPTLRIGQHMAEQLALKSSLPPEQHGARMVELLEAVRLPEPRRILSRYPHELSGGQQQRVAIALALAGDPAVLLLDEPTTALDATTKAFVLDVLRELAAARGLAMIYVSHDLGVIANVSQRVMVMYAGEAVEEGPVRAVLKAPNHPYTQGLIGSIPRIASEVLPQAIPGALPALSAERWACAFAPRCGRANHRCREAMPQPALVGDITVRCFFPGPEDAATPDSTRPNRRKRAGNADLLTLSGLEISYRKPNIVARILGGRDTPRSAVPALDLSVKAGEFLSLVGESGSGKSTILKAIAGLWPARRGAMVLHGVGPLPASVADRPLAMLRRLQLIFQNPDDSLNPRRTIGEILARPLRLYGNRNGATLGQRSTAVLESVRLNGGYAARRPAQLSGGEKQRVAIARALAADPDLLLCDEITSALDVSVQAAVLELILDVKQQSGKAMIFVSHDLAVVKHISDRVAILYRGEICELGETAEIFGSPGHPYTRMLIDSCLDPDPDIPRKPLPAEAAEAITAKAGCAFAARCPSRIQGLCETATPRWKNVTATHAARCHLLEG